MLTVDCVGVKLTISTILKIYLPIYRYLPNEYFIWKFIRKHHYRQFISFTFPYLFRFIWLLYFCLVILLSTLSKNSLPSRLLVAECTLLRHIFSHYSSWCHCKSNIIIPCLIDNFYIAFPYDYAYLYIWTRFSLWFFFFKNKFRIFSNQLY